MKSKFRLSKNQKKILLILLAGLAITLTRSIKGQWKIIKSLPEALKEIDAHSVGRSINSLFDSCLIKERQNKDGTSTMVLTKQGRRYALTFNIENIKLSKPKRWDKKWRIVMYDIPNRLNKIRESLRYQFKKIGLLELQKSAFVYPHDCRREIEYITKFYRADKYINFIIAESISNEDIFKKKFQLV